MDQLRETLMWVLIFLPPAGVALLWAAWRGWLRPSSLACVSPQSTGLRPVDLPIAILLYFCAQVLAVMILQLWGLMDYASPQEALPQGQTPQSSLGYATVVMVSQVIGFLPVAALLGWRLSKERGNLARFGLRLDRLGCDLFLGSVTLVWLLPVVFLSLASAALVGIVLGLPPPPEVGHDMLVVMQDSGSPLATVMMFTSAILIAPVTEEVLFRGLVQSSLRGALPPLVVVLLASGIFTVVHVGGVAPHTIPGLFVLGVVLGWVYERSGSLMPCIIAHAGFNALNVAMTLWPVD